MARKSKESLTKDAKPKTKETYQELARKLTPKLFKKLAQAAMNPESIAGKACWDKLWELSGEDSKPIPKVIKIKFAEIFADADGNIKELAQSPIEPIKPDPVIESKELNGKPESV